jgi:hypothetical protein
LVTMVPPAATALPPQVAVAVLLSLVTGGSAKRSPPACAKLLSLAVAVL